MNNRFIKDKKIPVCVIGTWAWGSGINGSKMVFGKTPKEEELIDSFSTCCDNGFTRWDTAEVYGMGNSEILLGRCIQQKQPRVIISTKYNPPKKYKPGLMRESLSKSLNRLNVNSIDLYWLHQPFCLEKNIKEAIILLKEGKIKALGLSNCSLAEIKKASIILQKEGYQLTGVQNHYSLLSMEEEQENIIKWCKENNAYYFAYMVLEQGALTGHYDYKHPFPFLSSRGLYFTKQKFKKIDMLIEYQRELAKKYNVTPSQIPIAWAISKNVIPIIGITNKKHAVDLSKGVNIKLATNEIESLERLAKQSNVISKRIWEYNRK